MRLSFTVWRFNDSARALYKGLDHEESLELDGEKTLKPVRAQKMYL